MKFLFPFLFVFAVGVSFAQEKMPQAPLETIVFEEIIGQFEKVELGVRLPEAVVIQINHFLQENEVLENESVNPFLEWELDIRAEFTHVESGKKIVKPGFYYRAMDRDVRINGWKDVDNTHPLRVRFSAEETGKWEARVELRIHNSTIYSSAPVYFEINSSENAGYVALTDNKLNFQRGGGVIIPSGVNLPHPYMGNNMLYSLHPEEKLKMESWKIFNEDVARFAKEGGKYFRFFMGASASDIEFEKLGNYYDRLNFAWEIDNMLAICESNDVLIDFNMLLHTPFMIAGDYYQFRWDYSNFWPDPKAWPYKDPNPIYCYAKEFNSKLPSDMFLNPEAMRYIKQRYRYMLARWGYSTSIMMWEPMSEPWHINEDGFNHITPYDNLNGDTERKAVHLFHKEIANYIKNDIGDKHLIGAVGRFPAGDKRIFSHPELDGITYSDSTWFDENIDVISISYYTPSPEKSILSKKGKSALRCEAGENSIYCVVHRLNEVYKKPVLFAESDHGDGTHVCSAMKGNKIDLMRYPISGAAGHFIWAAFGYSYGDHKYAIDERDVWKEAILAEGFFNSAHGKLVFEQKAAQGRERSSIRGVSKYIKNHEYLITENKLNGMGYIYNRTFNTHTAGSATGEQIKEDSPCFIVEPDYRKAQEITWKPNKMSLEGLAARQSYALRYYDFKNGSFVNEFEIRANMYGKTKLVHPVLGTTSSENPFYWYIIVPK